MFDGAAGRLPQEGTGGDNAYKRRRFTILMEPLYDRSQRCLITRDRHHNGLGQQIHKCNVGQGRNLGTCRRTGGGLSIADCSTFGVIAKPRLALRTLTFQQDHVAIHDFVFRLGGEKRLQTSATLSDNSYAAAGGGSRASRQLQQFPQSDTLFSMKVDPRLGDCAHDSEIAPTDRSLPDRRRIIAAGRRHQCRRNLGERNGFGLSLGPGGRDCSLHQQDFCFGESIGHRAAGKPGVRDGPQLRSRRKSASGPLRQARLRWRKDLCSCS